ncbi:MAG: hypothetical protein AAF941_10310 [Pseudomonadota bacterium]
MALAIGVSASANAGAEAPAQTEPQGKAYIPSEITPTDIDP